MSVGPVVVMGGAGFYGRYLVDDLLAQSSRDVIVASRRPGGHASTRVSTFEVDLRDRSRVRDLLDGAAVVVHCAGPFELLPTEVAQAAIDVRVPYIDISENRAFGRRLRDMDEPARGAGVPLLTGASVAPGFALVYAAEAVKRMDRVSAVHVVAAPDTRRHRGSAMFRTMLHGAGRAFDSSDGRVRHGWTERRPTDFPPPVRRGAGYLVFGMAEQDVLPSIFGGATVDFWAAGDISLANEALHWAARARRRAPRLPLERLGPAVRALSWLLGRFGTDDGAVVVEVHGEQDGQRVGERFGMVGVPDGGRIPILLASLGVESILCRPVAPGARYPHEWTDADLLDAAARSRGLVCWRSSMADGDWSSWRALSSGEDRRRP